MFHMFRKLFINTPKELLNRLVVWRIAKVSERNFLYLLAFVVGIFSGLAALLLKNLIHFVAHELTQVIDIEGFNYLFLLYPFIGILLTVVFVKFFVSEFLKFFDFNDSFCVFF